ncbi:pseudouridine synthase [Aspergillus heteromorphus CBS 117.55]|uniref:tRNA pseudouridine(55) synthase n=1 Tax=Aspergillus heteromorphus CBS 117.55 TaxID=1448321 RepID=A0A317WL87_9EURO|nr:pseudouridine synthase [Aspergillus heteromorphus CBS 117.55]PWY84980.1 pseudouridine synthase [Aspergillus heteromorphus CBS 117.55]
MSGEKIYEGVFAIHKPPTLSSATVLRDLQKHFNPSSTFAPWLAHETARLAAEDASQSRSARYNPRHRHRKNRNRKLEVKIGHGGTLDPLATGVLVAGIGAGTKSLPSFLGCTKTYTAVFVFGTETDTYDVLGKVVKRGPYEHITREMVEEKLGAFRGKIMQRPPIFSALRINGKRLYEYAREGTVPPVEIKEREVEVLDVKVEEWFEGGTHGWGPPTGGVMGGEEKVVAERLLEMESGSGSKAEGAGESEGKKRKDIDGDAEEEGTGKKLKGVEGEAVPVETEAEVESEKKAEAETPVEAETKPETETEPAEEPKETPPAVRISMTVTSGFYVRSLAHDLGRALGSCGYMSELVRNRQGDFVLEPSRVLEYKDLEAGEEVWGPKVRRFLEQWEAKRAAEQLELHEKQGGEKEEQQQQQQAKEEAKEE